MSRSGGGKLVKAVRLAVGGALSALSALIIWQVSADYTANRITTRQHADHYASHAQQRIERACRGSTGSAYLQCVAKEVAATREDQRAEYDLSAQNQMADWAFWMMLVSLGTMVVATIALAYVRETLKETQAMAREARRATHVALLGAKTSRQSIEETRRIGEAQTRAYLTGVSAELGFTETGSAVFKCTVKNSGQSPARSVECKASISFDTAAGFQTFSDPLEEVPSTLIDIAAGSEEIVSAYLKADGGLWVQDGEIWYLAAHVIIHAFDVFGRGIGEQERFYAFLDERPGPNDWALMERSGRHSSEDKERA